MTLEEAQAIGCKTLEDRVRKDAADGRDTSAAVVLFVRHTCPCQICQAWRQEERKARQDTALAQVRKAQRQREKRAAFTESLEGCLSSYASPGLPKREMAKILESSASRLTSEHYRERDGRRGTR